MFKSDVVSLLDRGLGDYLLCVGYPLTWVQLRLLSNKREDMNECMTRLLRTGFATFTDSAFPDCCFKALVLKFILLACECRGIAGYAPVGYVRVLALWRSGRRPAHIFSARGND